MIVVVEDKACFVGTSVAMISLFGDVDARSAETACGAFL
jgi:hypothetical protein